METGLLWIPILKKREAYREAFDGFDPEKMARYGDAKIQQVMTNAGLVINRLKILVAINNAPFFLNITNEYGSFNDMLWNYVDYTPIIGH